MLLELKNLLRRIFRGFCLFLISVFFSWTAYFLVFQGHALSYTRRHSIQTERSVPNCPVNKPMEFGDCANSEPPSRETVQKLMANDDTMQHFGNHYVYRAYYDIRQQDKPVVRIISVLPNKVQTPIHCHIYGNHANKSMHRTTVKAEYEMISIIYPDVELHAALLLCNLPHLPDTDPEFLILTEERCGPAAAALNIISPHTQSMKFNFTVCLHQPLFNVDETILPRIFEWIAVNRIFGADRFVIYYLESTKKLTDALQPLVGSGILETHQWNFSKVVADGFEGFYGQKSLINDCIYRHMYTSNRILLSDFDEIPTPVKDIDWASMLANSKCSKASATYFLNTFFPLNLKGDGKAKYNIISLVKTTRVNTFNECKSRSKVMLDPRAIKTGTVHEVYSFLDGNPSYCCMPTDNAYLHHYRVGNHSIDGKSIKSIGTVTDNRMREFEAQIVTSMKEIYELVGKDFNQLVL